MPDPAPTRSGRNSGHIDPLAKGARTRAAVLRAAVERFGRDGFRATSVTDIARDAGVGATVPYAYFPNKSELFRAALDEDAAGLILAVRPQVTDDPDDRRWRENLMTALVEAVEDHPLARRVLSGLEPEATGRMIELPALDELRKAAADRLRAGQHAGVVRHDIDPSSVANGSVMILVSLLMSVLQFGSAGVAEHGDDVLAVFEAAIDARP